MRKSIELTLLLTLLLLTAVGVAVADPPQEPLCPIGGEFGVLSSFSLYFGFCFDEHWAFEPYEWPNCDLLKKFNSNNGQGIGRPHYDPILEGYLSATNLVTDRPVVRTIVDESSFYGDWQAMEVVALSTRLMAREVLATLAIRPLSLVLSNDSGTPYDASDDCQVYYVSGETTPPPKATGKISWETYRLPVPSESAGLPQPNAGGDCPLPDQPCWGVIQGNDCPTKADYDLTWSTVIRDVDGIQLVWGHPEQSAQEGSWTIGVDQITRHSCQQP